MLVVCTKLLRRLQSKNLSDSCFTSTQILNLVQEFVAEGYVVKRVQDPSWEN